MVFVSSKLKGGNCHFKAVLRIRLYAPVPLELEGEGSDEAKEFYVTIGVTARDLATAAALAESRAIARTAEDIPGDGPVGEIEEAEFTLLCEEDIPDELVLGSRIQKEGIHFISGRIYYSEA